MSFLDRILRLISEINDNLNDPFRVNVIVALSALVACDIFGFDRDQVSSLLLVWCLGQINYFLFFWVPNRLMQNSESPRRHSSRVDTDGKHS